MRTLRTVGELRAALEPARRAGRTIGLVPTMGALHEGHLSLLTAARAQCDVVVMSLFVNPAQFNERADLDRYPRREHDDSLLAEQAGVDLLFAPSREEVYPTGFSTYVEVLGLTDRLEGAVRGSAHFRGVATVVAKLLNMVAPNTAYFGQKDAQQVVVIRRLVADLNLPVHVVACPTVREPDGLAMSSRNAHLSAKERTRALALHNALVAASAAAQRGERSGEELVRIAHRAMTHLGVQPEYLALVGPETLEPVVRLEHPALLAIAARVGDTRLIDNVTLRPAVHLGAQPAAQPVAQPATQPIAQPATQPITQPAAQSIVRPAQATATQPTPKPAVRPNSQHPTQREAPATCSA
jgi:pantoate--beta-alanine ligase